MKTDYGKLPINWVSAAKWIATLSVSAAWTLLLYLAGHRVWSYLQ